MKNKSSFSPRWSSLVAASLLVIGSIQMSIGELIFFDTFDSETVGAFPSTWTNVASGPSAKIYVTNNIAGTPTVPNVFQFSNLNSSETFTAWRQFPTYSLNTVSNLVINFKLNISTIPTGGSLGFVIGPANLPTQGEETFAIPRFTSGASAGTFSVLIGGTTRTNNIPLNSWNDFRMEIDPNANIATNGVVRWYLNNSFFFTENFQVPTTSRTNINTLFVHDTFTGSTPHPITTFYLDNVLIFSEVPEPSALLLITTGLGLVALRARRMRGS